jgi:hypothetical protein
MTKKEWGSIYEALALIASCGPAMVGGCISAANGEGFDKGFDVVMGGACKLGQSFGEEYGKTVAKTTVKIGTFVILGGIYDGVCGPSSDD